MKLFHAFPRLLHRSGPTGKIVRRSPTEADRSKGFDILRMILTHGLLCTPENFPLYPNYHTENKQKKEFLRAGKSHDSIIQSRACFTLADARELSQVYEITSDNEKQHVAHIDLFGEFAIGLDPLDARALGILPTVYYYKQDIGEGFRKTAGLGWQIVERLDEARNVFSILSYLECWSNKGPEYDPIYPNAERLREMGILIRHQPEIEQELAKLEAKDADLILRIFDTDRVPAWNFVDFIQMLLSLYQTADSTIADAPLAFFRQKEWRIIHHKTEHLAWFGLGQHKSYRNPLALKYCDAINELRDFIRTGRNDPSEWYLDQCWVLARSGDRHFRDFVREIVVPQSHVERAKELVESKSFVGDPPVITPLPRKWRIAFGEDMPVVEAAD